MRYDLLLSSIGDHKLSTPMYRTLISKEFRNDMTDNFAMPALICFLFDHFAYFFKMSHYKGLLYPKEV
jgi:hypothetical protein